MADNLEQIANDLNTASLNLQELRGKYEGALDVLNAKNAEIIEALDSKKEEALQEVKGVKDTATTEITNLQDTVLSNIDESKNASITELTNKKTEALAKIEEAKTEQGEKIAKLETELNLKAKLLTQNLELTVGNGENFSKLSEALEEALKYVAIKNTYTITIKLKSGYVLNERIELISALADHIAIISEDEKIMVDYDPKEDYLFTFKGSVAPKINCLFDATGTTAKGMYFLNSMAKMLALNENKYKFGFINLKKNAVVVENSRVILNGYNLSENAKNLNTQINQDVLYCSGHGELDLVECKLDNNGSLVNGWLYYVGYASKLSLINCSCLNNKSNYNILNNNNSYLNAQSSNFTGSKGNFLLRSFNGGGSNLQGVNTDSCTWSNSELPFAVNSLTRDGIIYK
ncbi:hypothetical protein ACD574_02190 [Campylobacter sp. LH-2024]|uniref:hypothetical protein n=1 Tax=Campylobacter sp. LH-2024 TaxID=3239825 RepID=UPI003B784FB7